MKRRILPLLLVLCLLWLTGCSFDDTSDEDLLQEIYGYYQSGKDKTDAPAHVVRAARAAGADARPDHLSRRGAADDRGAAL